MRKEIIATLIFILMYSAIASADLSDKINEANHLLKVMQPDQDCVACQVALSQEVSNAAKSRMQDCVESICGKSNLTSYPAVTTAALRDAIKPDSQYDAKIAPILKKIALASSKQKIEDAQISLAFAQHPNLNVADSTKRLFNVLDAQNKLEKFKINVDSFGMLGLDVAASRNQFPTLTDDQFRNLTTVASAYIALNNSVPFHTTDVSALLLDYSRDDIKKMIKSSIDALVSQSERLQHNPDLKSVFAFPSSRQYYSREALEEPFANDHLDSDGLMQLNHIAMSLNLFEATSTDDNLRQALDRIPINLQDFLRTSGVTKNLQDRIALAQNAIKQSGDVKSDSCKFVFESAKHSLPTQKQIDDAMTFTSKFAPTFASKTKDLLCVAGKSDYLSKVQRWNATFPPSREGFIEILRWV